MAGAIVQPPAVVVGAVAGQCEQAGERAEHRIGGGEAGLEQLDADQVLLCQRVGAAVGRHNHQRHVVGAVGELVLRIEVVGAAPVVKIPVAGHRPLRLVHEMDGA